MSFEIGNWNEETIGNIFAAFFKDLLDISWPLNDKIIETIIVDFYRFYDNAKE